MSTTREILAELTDDLAAEGLTGLVVMATYKGGRVTLQYTDHVAKHPACVIGYLYKLCQDLANLINQ